MAMVILTSRNVVVVKITDGNTRDTFLPDDPQDFVLFFDHYFPVCVQNVLDRYDLMVSWKTFVELNDSIAPMFRNEVQIKDPMDDIKTIYDISKQIFRKIKWFNRELTFKISLLGK